MPETLRCPDCGSTEISLREDESSPMIKWFNCKNGHKFFKKTRWARAGEFSGLVIAGTVFTRLLLEHHDLGDIFDDASGGSF